MSEKKKNFQHQSLLIFVVNKSDRKTSNPIQSALRRAYCGLGNKSVRSNRFSRSVYIEQDDEIVAIYQDRATNLRLSQEELNDDVAVILDRLSPDPRDRTFSAVEVELMRQGRKLEAVNSIRIRCPKMGLREAKELVETEGVKYLRVSGMYDDKGRIITN